MVQSYQPIFRSHCTLFLFFSDQSFIQLILLFLFPVYIVFQISIFIGDAYLRIKNILRLESGTIVRKKSDYCPIFF